jgi:co-chaperonin GroES (HSP10)
MQAFGNKIFVKVYDKESVTTSGIILVNVDKREKPRFGEVVSIGHNVTDVKTGDILSFGNYALSSPVNDLFVMEMGDVLGYFKRK